MAAGALAGCWSACCCTPGTCASSTAPGFIPPAPPAARQYVEQLKQAGILREITGYARSRLYQADEILYTIEGSLLGE